MVNISKFRQLVDETAQITMQWPCDLIAQYQFLGLPLTDNYSARFIDEELNNFIHRSFSSGDVKIADQCKDLIGELIYDQILCNIPVEPYCDLLGKIRDATRLKQTIGNDTEQEWRKAIEIAHFSVQQMNLNVEEGLKRTYPNFYAVGWATKRLRSIGYSIDRNGSKLTLREEVESRLVAQIESLVREFGGLYVVTQMGNIFREVYDERQERYHLVVPRPEVKDPLQPLIPWGYLLQLAVKHYQGGKPCVVNNFQRFRFLIALIQDYATLLEVQDYSYFPHFPFMPDKMILAVQKKALEDSIYKIPQVRASDITRILYGLIDSSILDDPFEKGWSIRQAISVIDVILNKLTTRGMSRIFAREVRKHCPLIDKDIVNFILSDVLSHPQTGSNQKFFRPVDAATVLPNQSQQDGPDFSQLPLLKYTNQSYILLDRSFCASAFIEAILFQLRKKYQKIDDNYLGKALERFTRAVLLQHNIKSTSGNYWCDKKRWECDIVVETASSIILIEVKKKALTRRARAGADISLVLDLAQSLLDAQKQAGNHEMQLYKEGYLDLDDNGEINRIELKGRKVERIALSFTDFGSFHDRMFLEKFLNAVSTVKFGTHNLEYERKFAEINRSIVLLQRQCAFLNSENDKHYRPYFNCWFFSLPQLMIILDGVDGPEVFREVLWGMRGMSNGYGDLYFDLHYIERTKANSPEIYRAMRKMADNDKTFVAR